MDSGIYRITCLANGKRYVGSSVELRQRWSNHKSDLRKRRHANIHLQRCHDKYGEASLVFEVLEEVAPDRLFMAEAAWLATGPELNINPRPDAPMRGVRMSQEHKAKIRAAHKKLGTRPPGFKKGQRHTAETKAKMSRSKMGNSWNKGRVKSTVHLANLSAALKGRKLSDEHRAALRVSAKRRCARV